MAVHPNVNRDLPTNIRQLIVGVEESLRDGEDLTVSSMLEKLPQDATCEDIQYHLYVLEKVNRGLERAEKKGTVSHESAKSRLGKWLTP